ncbi:sulfite exporter TauE/SafE family protein [Thalassotalea sp. PS06]|uniref:sulfite exporter TauE/SafE family protein n=1 Tax=Thalassotalea sp. PS06 TaxID=2594005 RepID=UPI0011653075|nr:sulfite exporter TauE/SafE family protein [Thalassotalea sp. PS06]QDP02525.1 sulfite exporter TauE/SafE family protein [Thalassotalea sp. PS06]
MSKKSNALTMSVSSVNTSNAEIQVTERINRPVFWCMFVFALLSVWLICLMSFESPLETIKEYFGFLFLGIGGAIAANSTGAGGGIVFVPSFSALGMEIEQVIATSVAIQCFGMTVGSLTWLYWFHRKNTVSNDQTTIAAAPESLSLIFRALLYCAPASILGMWLVQYLPLPPIGDVNLIFSIFSLVFGVLVLAQVVMIGDKVRHTEQSFSNANVVLLVIASLIGGIITAWISVGVGEIIAVVLLLLGFSVMYSVAVGVVVSAITVIAGIADFALQGLVVSEVLLFAAPGAMIGGFIARFIAQALGGMRLKIFLGSWILLVGIAGIF